jgi:hypothetical protein
MTGRLDWSAALAQDTSAAPAPQSSPVSIIVRRVISALTSWAMSSPHELCRSRDALIVEPNEPCREAAQG